MPYPNEHACRVRDPKQFKEMRRVNKTLRKWAKAHDFSCADFEPAAEPAAHAKLKTVDLDGEEVFAAGKWTSSNGKTREYSVDDLHLMCEAAREMGDRFKAPVKLGHNDKQKLADIDGVFGDDGKPAFGWMKNLRVRGSKLVADLKGVPAKLAELIKAGAYKNKSFENYNDYTDEVSGKKYKYMPCGVALLGASLPALANLNELAALYSTDGVPGNSVYLFQAERGDESMTTEEQKKMDDLMKENADMKKELGEYKSKHEVDAKAEKDAADAKLKDAETKVTEHAAQIETDKKEIGDLKAKLTAIESEKAEADAKHRAAETAAFLDKHSRKIQPILRPIIEEKLNSAAAEPEKFSMKIGDTELTGLDAFKAYIEKLPESELFGDAGKTSKDTEGQPNEDAEDFYERVEKPAAVKYCEDNKLSVNDALQFGDAVTAVRNARKAAK